MAIKKMPIGLFVAELEAALNRGDGYIMGAKGQNPATLNNWYFEQYADRDNYSEKQEEKALYWKKHAARVWDCNGLPEGIYEGYSGVNINTKARYNYSGWCEPKGTGMIPAEYRVPGAAVFTGKKAADIPHVMFLYKPVDADKQDGDWYLIEARGVTYGVVKTRLYSRKPTFWGHMTKYFDYGNGDASTEATNPETVRTLRIGDSGADVEAVQKLLLKWDKNCLPNYGADGDFGNETEIAVRAYQAGKGIKIDGIVGAETLEALQALNVKNPYKEPEKNIKKGYKGNGVRWVQWELKRYDPEMMLKYGIDGDFGNETLKAVKAFQRARGLKVDGIVGKQTRAALKENA